MVKTIPVLMRAVDHWMSSENGLPQSGHRFFLRNEETVTHRDPLATRDLRR